MSLPLSRRRLVISSTSFIPQSSCQSYTLPLLITCSHTYPSIQHRSLSLNPFKRKKPKVQLDAENIQKLGSKAKAKARSELPKAGATPIPGNLAPTSIFEQELPGESTREGGLSRPRVGPVPFSTVKGRDPKVMAAALNPRPRARQRWLRKMVIRNVRGRGRLNKTEKILRTERSHLSKSPLIKASVKKLYPLARQIAGKPLTEAMVQMRFSKKKAARDVLRHLEIARDEAVVAKGMGLGAVGEEKAEDKEKAVLVEDKKGKKRMVKDLSQMYIDEAWVGRGKYEKDLDYRARGAGYFLYLPFTSISVVLKEEATRLRLQEERELKRQKKKVWVPLPDRPVTAQRQYPLW
ncbi:hypothetical protein JMJ35_000550 [Cladonia borealis]|uniref:Ribosomal protein L22 n=1 Tax=Cladonia borealis TaxID=184061 RepID=A0AA39VA39_9LECA|nr:hypothetical protein JMJ35_000550 [Cladonia borealis]